MSSEAPGPLRTLYSTLAAAETARLRDAEAALARDVVRPHVLDLAHWRMVAADQLACEPLRFEHMNTEHHCWWSTMYSNAVLTVARELATPGFSLGGDGGSSWHLDVTLRRTAPTKGGTIKTQRRRSTRRPPAVASNLAALWDAVVGRDGQAYWAHLHAEADRLVAHCLDPAHWPHSQQPSAPYTYSSRCCYHHHRAVEELAARRLGEGPLAVTFEDAGYLQVVGKFKWTFPGHEADMDSDI